MAFLIVSGDRMRWWVRLLSFPAIGVVLTVVIVVSEWVCFGGMEMYCRCRWRMRDEVKSGGCWCFKLRVRVRGSGMLRIGVVEEGEKKGRVSCELMRLNVIVVLRVWGGERGLACCMLLLY
jgi:hypothetical protein